MTVKFKIKPFVNLNNANLNGCSLINAFKLGMKVLNLGIKGLIYPKIEKVEKCGVPGYWSKLLYITASYKFVQCGKYPAYPRCGVLRKLLKSLKFSADFLGDFWKVRKIILPGICCALFVNLTLVNFTVYLLFPVVFYTFIWGIGVYSIYSKKNQQLTNTPHLGYCGVLRGILKLECEP